MLTRSGVDENTILCSGFTNKTKAKAIVALSVDITVPSQSKVKEEQTIINEDDQETNGQHPVSSKQQVGELLIVPNEFDDTAELIIDVIDATTINQSIDDKLFIEHSPPSSYANNAILYRASYPDTIEGCIKVIVELRHAEKALHLTITENEHVLECLQSNPLGNLTGDGLDT